VTVVTMTMCSFTHFRTLSKEAHRARSSHNQSNRLSHPPVKPVDDTQSPQDC
jgi:hypothetical protein